MKIYFAGSISGGREDLKIYQELVSVIEVYGEVLTKQVSNPKVTGKVVPVDNDGNKVSEEWIHNRDRKSMEEADILIAETTVPSTGVGYEIGLAESKGIPVLIIYRKSEKRASPVIIGNKRFYLQAIQ